MSYTEEESARQELSSLAHWRYVSQYLILTYLIFVLLEVSICTSFTFAAIL